MRDEGIAFAQPILRADELVTPLLCRVMFVCYQTRQRMRASRVTIVTSKNRPSQKLKRSLQLSPDSSRTNSRLGMFERLIAYLNDTRSRRPVSRHSCIY